MVKVSMCGSSASCAYGKAGNVNDIVYSLGCKDRKTGKRDKGLGWRVLSWRRGYNEVGIENLVIYRLARKKDFISSDASSAKSPVSKTVLG